MDRNQFYERYSEYYEEDIRTIPSMVPQKKIELYDLYSCVLKHGGYASVSRNSKWLKIAKEFGLVNKERKTQLCELRDIKDYYLKYLREFERIQDNARKGKIINRTKSSASKTRTATDRRRKDVSNSSNVTTLLNGSCSGSFNNMCDPSLSGSFNNTFDTKNYNNTSFNSVNSSNFNNSFSGSFNNNYMNNMSNSFNSLNNSFGNSLGSNAGNSFGHSFNNNLNSSFNNRLSNGLGNSLNSLNNTLSNSLNSNLSNNVSNALSSNINNNLMNNRFNGSFINTFSNGYNTSFNNSFHTENMHMGNGYKWEPYMNNISKGNYPGLLNGYNKVYENDGIPYNMMGLKNNNLYLDSNINRMNQVMCMKYMNNPYMLSPLPPSQFPLSLPLQLQMHMNMGMNLGMDMAVGTGMGAGVGVSVGAGMGPEVDIVPDVGSGTGIGSNMDMNMGTNPVVYFNNMENSFLGNNANVIMNNNMNFSSNEKTSMHMNENMNGFVSETVDEYIPLKITTAVDTKENKELLKKHPCIDVYRILLAIHNRKENFADFILSLNIFYVLSNNPDILSFNQLHVSVFFLLNALEDLCSAMFKNCKIKDRSLLIMMSAFNTEVLTKESVKMTGRGNREVRTGKKEQGRKRRKKCKKRQKEKGERKEKLGNSLFSKSENVKEVQERGKYLKELACNKDMKKNAEVSYSGWSREEIFGSEQEDISDVHGRKRSKAIMVSLKSEEIRIEEFQQLYQTYFDYCEKKKKYIRQRKRAWEATGKNEDLTKEKSQGVNVGEQTNTCFEANNMLEAKTKREKERTEETSEEEKENEAKVELADGYGKKEKNKEETIGSEGEGAPLLFSADDNEWSISESVRSSDLENLYEGKEREGYNVSDRKRKERRTKRKRMSSAVNYTRFAYLILYTLNNLFLINKYMLHYANIKVYYKKKKGENGKTSKDVMNGSVNGGAPMENRLEVENVLKSNIGRDINGMRFTNTTTSPTVGNASSVGKQRKQLNNVTLLEFSGNMKGHARSTSESPSIYSDLSSSCVLSDLSFSTSSTNKSKKSFKSDKSKRSDQFKKVKKSEKATFNRGRTRSYTRMLSEHNGVIQEEAQSNNNNQNSNNNNNKMPDVKYESPVDRRRGKRRKEHLVENMTNEMHIDKERYGEKKCDIFNSGVGETLMEHLNMNNINEGDNGNGSSSRHGENGVNNASMNNKVHSFEKTNRNIRKRCTVNRNENILSLDDDSYRKADENDNSRSRSNSKELFNKHMNKDCNNNVDSNSAGKCNIFRSRLFASSDANASEVGQEQEKYKRYIFNNSEENMLSQDYKSMLNCPSGENGMHSVDECGHLRLNGKSRALRSTRKSAPANSYKYRGVELFDNHTNEGTRDNEAVGNIHTSGKYKDKREVLPMKMPSMESTWSKEIKGDIGVNGISKVGGYRGKVMEQAYHERENVDLKNMEMLQDGKELKQKNIEQCVEMPNSCEKRNCSLNMSMLRNMNDSSILSSSFWGDSNISTGIGNSNQLDNSPHQNSVNEWANVKMKTPPHFNVTELNAGCGEEMKELKDSQHTNNTSPVTNCSHDMANTTFNSNCCPNNFNLGESKEEIDGRGNLLNISGSALNEDGNAYLNNNSCMHDVSNSEKQQINGNEKQNIGQPMERPIKQCLKQSMKQTLKQSLKQPMRRYSKRHTKQHINQTRNCTSSVDEKNKQECSYNFENRKFVKQESKGPNMLKENSGCSNLCSCNEFLGNQCCAKSTKILSDDKKYIYNENEENRFGDGDVNNVDLLSEGGKEKRCTNNGTTHMDETKETENMLKFNTTDNNDNKKVKRIYKRMKKKIYNEIKELFIKNKTKEDCAKLLRNFEFSTFISIFEMILLKTYETVFVYERVIQNIYINMFICVDIVNEELGEDIGFKYLFLPINLLNKNKDFSVVAHLNEHFEVRIVPIEKNSADSNECGSEGQGKRKEQSRERTSNEIGTRESLYRKGEMENANCGRGEKTKGNEKEKEEGKVERDIQIRNEDITKNKKYKNYEGERINGTEVRREDETNKEKEIRKENGKKMETEKETCRGKSPPCYVDKMKKLFLTIFKRNNNRYNIYKGVDMGHLKEYYNYKNCVCEEKKKHKGELILYIHEITSKYVSKVYEKVNKYLNLVTVSLNILTRLVHLIPKKILSASMILFLLNKLINVKCFFCTLKIPLCMLNKNGYTFLETLMKFISYIINSDAMPIHNYLLPFMRVCSIPLQIFLYSDMSALSDTFMLTALSTLYKLVTYDTDFLVGEETILDINEDPTLTCLIQESKTESTKCADKIACAGSSANKLNSKRIELLEQVFLKPLLVFLKKLICFKSIFHCSNINEREEMLVDRKRVEPVLKKFLMLDDTVENMNRETFSASVDSDIVLHIHDRLLLYAKNNSYIPDSAKDINMYNTMKKAYTNVTTSSNSFSCDIVSSNSEKQELHICARAVMPILLFLSSHEVLWSCLTPHIPLLTHIAFMETDIRGSLWVILKEHHFRSLRRNEKKCILRNPSSHSQDDQNNNNKREFDFRLIKVLRIK